MLDRIVVVQDLTGIGLRSMHMPFVNMMKLAIRTRTEHYPQASSALHRRPVHRARLMTLSPRVSPHHLPRLFRHLLSTLGFEAHDCHQCAHCHQRPLCTRQAASLRTDQTKNYFHCWQARKAPVQDDRDVRTRDYFVFGVPYYCLLLHHSETQLYAPHLSDAGNISLDGTAARHRTPRTQSRQSPASNTSRRARSGSPVRSVFASARGPLSACLTFYKYAGRGVKTCFVSTALSFTFTVLAPGKRLTPVAGRRVRRRRRVRVGWHIPGNTGRKSVRPNRALLLLMLQV